MENRLKPSEVKTAREAMLHAGGMRCALCGLPCSFDQAVLDHDHQTGLIRGVIHNNCNVVLGRLENASRRYRTDLKAFIQGVETYLAIPSEIYHPTHRTADEKKALLKKRALKRKAAK